MDNAKIPAIAERVPDHRDLTDGKPSISSLDANKPKNGRRVS